MNPWIPHLLRAGGGGGAVLPPTGRAFLMSKSSLILDEGTGGPTWSRATKAWGFNELRYLEELASGSAFFGGARLVRNTVRTKSEDFSNDAWAKSNVTVTGTNTIVCTNATTPQYVYQTAAAGIVVGGTYGLGARVKYVSGGADFIQVATHITGFGSAFVNVNLQTGAYSATGCSATITPVSGGGYDVFISAVAIASGSYDYVVVAIVNNLAAARIESFVGDGIKSFELLRAWSVDVTGYDSSYVPEYVSVGSDTNKNFLLHTDDFSQAAWSKTNITLTQSAIANPVNGRIDAQKIEATAGAATQLIQTVTGAGSASGMALVLYVKKGSGATDMQTFALRNNTTATNVLGGRINYDTGVITYYAGSSGITAVDVGNGWWKLSLISATGFSANDNITVYLGSNGSAETAGEFCYIYRPYLGRGTTVPAVLPAVAGVWDPFGAGIDGAKYFETDWQGAPIAAANLLGFRRETAATNNILQCRNLTQNAWGAPANGGVGSEVLTNGTFADSTGWTQEAAAYWSISGGLANLNAPDGTAAYLSNTQTYGSLVTGKQYVIEFDYTHTSGNALIPTLRGSDAKAIGNSTGRKTITITCGASVAGYGLRFQSFGACVATIDNITIKEAPVQCAQTATGLDGIANTATTLTAAAADAIILQAISLTSAARCASAYVKRRTGTGTISFTQDGGSTWTDITSQINSSTWSRVEITATLANPSVGFKISTSGDAIDVDCVQNEAGAVATSPIVTTTAAVTRNADSLSYQTASNWSDTAGTLYFEAQPYEWKDAKAVAQSYLYNIKSGIYTWDGTASAYGPDGIPSGREKLAMRWSTVTGKQNAASSGGVGSVEAPYDGSWGMASITIFSAAVGYCGSVAIYNYAMTDAELQAITA